jgi:dihydroorotate dehydrogenase (fumarate)
MDLSTNYMGLALRNPLVASASPLNADLGNIRALEDCGAGAVVLPSIFAEQIEMEERRYEAITNAGVLSSPEAASYFPKPGTDGADSDRYLDLLVSAKKAVSIPIIASLNAATAESWTGYAKQLQEAGADALELNIYLLPTDIRITGRDIEQRYLDIVRAVKSEVTISVAVKVGPYFSSPGNMAAELVTAGAGALVLFNRFYQPDIDLVRLGITNDLDLSRQVEMRLPLLWIAVLHGRIGSSLAASTGVHTSDDVVKYLLAGADVVMTTSALLENGVKHMRTLAGGLAEWLQQRDMQSVSCIRGLLSHGKIRNPEEYERANYIKILQGYETQVS